jgi:hypothetical protein
MKKFRGLKLLGLVAFLSIALVFIGINYSHAQGKGKGKKPPAQDEYVWSAVILDGPFSIQGRGENIYDGMGGHGSIYDPSVTNINVTGDVKAVGRTKSPHLVRSYFLLEIFYPVEDETLYQIQFTENISNKNATFELNPPPVDLDLNPDIYFKYLGFPLWGSAVDDPSERDALEIFDFLQNCDHPFDVGINENYYKLELSFSSEWVDNLYDGTYDNWAIDDPKLMGYGGWLFIEGQDADTFSCDRDDYDPWHYHNIIGDAHFRGDEKWGGWPGYIVRISEDIWKVVVVGRMCFNEEYGECVTKYFNKKRTMNQIEDFEPIYADCYMNFEVLFIRTKI